MLIEASWTSTHDIGTYGFRQVESSTPGPTHIVLTESELQMWLAIRGYCAVEKQLENLQKPKTLLSMSDIADRTSHQFDIYLREVLGQIFLLAQTADGRQREVEYMEEQACLEATLLLGIGLPTQTDTIAASLQDWTKLFTYDPAKMNLSSATMPASMPEARRAQGEMMKKKHMPLWFPRTLCISLN